MLHVYRPSTPTPVVIVVGLERHPEEICACTAYCPLVSETAGSV